MLEENANPNTNNQVHEDHCPPAEKCLAQRKRSQPADGQSVIPPLSDQKRRRQAGFAKHAQNFSKVNIHKALRVNIIEAVGELVIHDSENRTSRSQVCMTELCEARWRDMLWSRPCQQPRDYQGSWSYTFLLHGRAQFFGISDKIWEAWTWQNTVWFFGQDLNSLSNGRWHQRILQRAWIHMKYLQQNAPNATSGLYIPIRNSCHWTQSRDPVPQV
jgi:hypothetical protein